jgi:hypothetical protein
LVSVAIGYSLIALAASGNSIPSTLPVAALGQMLGERVQLAAPIRPCSGRIQPALFDPASYGVIADSRQGGCLAGPQIRHRRHPLAANAAGMPQSKAITVLVNELCSLCRPRVDDLVDAFGAPGAVVDVPMVVPSQHE